MRIKAKSELRLRIAKLADQTWEEIEQIEKPFHDHKEHFFTSHQKQIEYDWQQFREELFPLYRKMLEIFTEKYWLADPDTRQYYKDYLDYVELWERHLSGSTPFEVMQKIRPEQDKLKPFYDHLEERMEKLRQELKDEKFFRYR